MEKEFAQVQINEEFLKGMEKALQHNKFASVLFQCDKLDQALDHYEKALKIAEEICLPYSNLHQNIGNVYAQKKEYELAKKHYEQVLKISPHSNLSKYKDLPKPAEGKEEETPQQAILWESRLNSFDAYVDALTNLSFTLLGMGLPAQAVGYCKQSLGLRYNKEAHINFGNSLRQMGQRDEAINLVIDSIRIDKRNCGQSDFELERLDLKNCPEPPEEIINENIYILTVKWGTKYNSEYVNKLYRGFKRNTQKAFKFICFTDDPSGLDVEIEPRKLVENWKSWWGKASIFSKEHKLEGLKFFIDLDMIITGNLDDLLSFKGKFCLLRTDELYCETLNKNGYNSSIILWRSDYFEPIYTSLKACYEEVNKYIYRYVESQLGLTTGWR